MELTEKEKIQEQISALRWISKSLFDSGDCDKGEAVKNVVNNLSGIIKNM